MSGEDPYYYFDSLKNIDIVNVYSCGSKIKNFGQFKMSAGSNIQDAAIQGQLHISTEFQPTLSTWGDCEFPFKPKGNVCIPFGTVYFPLTYIFYGRIGDQEEVILETTFERNIIDKTGNVYIEIVLGRILGNQNPNPIIYDEILASVIVGQVEYEDHCGNRKIVKNWDEHAMNGEFTVYGKHRVENS